jgi:predicted negative regulator of RcsB-dependent stress response
MHFNLEEQEQLAEFKAWWKQYGKWLIAILILILLSYTSFTAWNWWQNRSSLAASKLYDTLLVSAQKQDVSGVLRATKDLQDQYSSTSYAGMAGLVAAQVDKPDFAEAEKVASASVSTAFEPLLLERRGDVQFAQKKTVEARQFYQQAWDKLAKNPDAADESKRLLKIKLDAVGGR